MSTNSLISCLHGLSLDCRLKAIFQILCPREQSNLPIPGSDALPKTSVNQYELLEGLAIDSDLDHTELDASATANTTKTDNRTRKSAQPSREDPAIIDDDLLLQLHTFYYLLVSKHLLHWGQPVDVEVDTNIFSGVRSCVLSYQRLLGASHGWLHVNYACGMALQLCM